MVQKLLVDTDILLDVGRREEIAIARLEAEAQTSTLAISVITQMEMLVGCRNQTQLQILESLSNGVPMVAIPITITLAHHYNLLKKRKSDVVQERDRQTKVQSPRKRLFLWLWWILVTTAGGTIIGALSAPTDFFWYIFMTGLVVGAAQWLVLRRYMQHAGWWVVASAFGWFLGINVDIMTGGVLAPIVELLSSVGGLWKVFWLNVVSDLVIFAVLGVAQWLVLHRHTQHAGWWVLANVIGGAVNGAVGSTVCAAACQVGGAALSSSAGWAGNGAVTGIILVWLLPKGTKLERQR